MIGPTIGATAATAAGLAKAAGLAPMAFAPGDIIAFDGASAISNVIKLATYSRWSHVGIIANITRAQLLAGRPVGSIAPKILDAWPKEGRLLLIESTTLCDSPCEITGLPIRGVQAHEPESRVKAYEGSVYRLPISRDWEFSESEANQVAMYLLSKIGTPYDGVQAAMAGGVWLKRWFWNPEDWNRAFCSKLVCGLFKRLQRFPMQNCNLVSPAQVVNITQDDGTHQGPPQLIWQAPST